MKTRQAIIEIETITVLEWAAKQDRRLDRIFNGKRPVYDYKVLGPLSTEDPAELTLFVRLNKQDKGTWYRLPFEGGLRDIEKREVIGLHKNKKKLKNMLT